MENLSQSQFGPFVLDVRERVLRRDGQPVPLTPKAFDLLAALAEHPGRLQSKDELLQRVWPHSFVEEANLAYNVFAIRKALGDTADNGQYIETVSKRGYRFTTAVTPVLGGDAASALVEARASVFSRRGAAALAVAMLVGTSYLAVQWSRTSPPPETLRALPLTSMAGVVRSPSLSPDGSHVVFTWAGEKQDNSDVYVRQVGAGDHLRLTTDLSNDYSPSWSPDGRTIVFLRRERSGGLKSEVRLIAPLGGPERRLADIQPRMAHFTPPSVSWCPDSTCVLVTDAQDEGRMDAVFAISVLTGEKRQLTHPPQEALDADPVISPDGRSLIFRRDSTPFSGEFHRLSLKSPMVPEGDAVRLTPTLSAGKPAWLPDGREIVFAAHGCLWRLDAFKGGAPMRVPFVGQDGLTPVISRAHDGRQRLVYVRSLTDGNVWRVDTATPGAAASSPPVAAISSTRFDGIANLSPDGRQVAFTSNRSGGSEIWVSAPDGSRAIPLTSMGVTPGFPRWSPDGKMIAFHADPEARPDVLVVPSGGGRPQNLTIKLRNGAFPSFSRDGRWIYVTVVDAGAARIWKMPAAGGAAVQVTMNAGTIGVESPDGRDLYYVEAANRTSSLWRLPLAGGPPVKLLDGVVLGNFDVVDGGIYYIDRASADAEGHSASRPAGETRLQYFDFATNRSSTVAANLGTVGFGLSASPDGRSVFFSRIDSSVHELMLVENFR